MGPLENRLFLHRLSLYLLPASVLLCTFLGLQARRVFADQSGAAVISEVMWMGSDVSTADEWLEIACVGSSDCDLSGWQLTSAKSTGEEATMLTFATGSLLSGGDVRVIGHYPGSSSRLSADPWIVTSSLSLPNTKLLLKLIDPAGAIRDEADDGVGNPFAGANPSGGAKASMERIDLSAPGNLPDNWRTSTESSGFDPGSPIFGTPGSISPPPLPSPGGGGSSANSLPPPGEGTGMGENSSSSLSSFSSVSSESFLSSSISISSSGESGSGYSLSSSESSSGTIISSSSSLDYARDDTAVPSATSASSASSVSSTSSFSQAGTPAPLADMRVFITEVLANPLGADTDEWIEVGNLGEVSVNIAGWILDDGNSTASYLIPARNASAFLLAPGGHVSFRKSVTHLTLDNSGERVSLMSGALLIDAFEYPLTAEEVSYGREPGHPESLRPFCVPTEGKANTADALSPRIVIQDAGSASYGASSVVGTEHISLNLTTEVGAGSLASASCLWDFDDDQVSTSCNPPSHTFSDPGDFTVRLTVRDYCGDFSVATLSVTVLPEEEGETAPSVTSATSVSSPHQSSAGASDGAGQAASSVSSSRSSSLSSVPAVLMTPIRVETGVILSEVMMTGDEWIELFNPMDHAIALDGWMLDDLKNGGSKPWIIPPGTTMRPGEFRIFPGSETKLKLNDSGDDVWLIAPGERWSQHVTVPKLKAGSSFSFCDGEPARRSLGEAQAKPDEVGWRASDSTPGRVNACRSSASSSSSVKSKQVKNPSPRSIAQSPFPTRTIITDWPGTSASGVFVLTGSQVDLPPALVTAGTSSAGTKAAEAGAAGGLGLLGVALVLVRRKWFWP